MHPFLRPTDSGDVAIRWSKVVVFLVFNVGCGAITVLALHHFVGKPVYVTRIATFSIVPVLIWAIMLYFLKRHAQGKSLRQFSLLTLFTVTTVACILLGLMSLDRSSDLARYTKRKQLE